MSGRGETSPGWISASEKVSKPLAYASHADAPTLLVWPTVTRPAREMFEALDVTDVEERVYLALLEHSPTSATRLSSLLALPARRVQETVASLVGKGLATRIPARPPEFAAVPPEIAVVSLIRRRRDELDVAGVAAQQLADRVRKNRGLDPVGFLDLITERSVVRNTYLQIERAAESDIAAIDLPPHMRQLRGEVERETRAVDVRYRLICDQTSLDRTAELHVVDALAATGHEVRVIADVPLSMMITDASLGLIVLSSDGAEPDSVLMVRPSPLLDGLNRLFEELWANGALARPDGTRGDGAGPAALAEPDRRLITLMALGVKDAAISRQLGIGLRTIQRRIADLMTALGARTRFQAGVMAVNRGWTRPPSHPQGLEPELPSREPGAGPRPSRSS